MGGKKIVVFYDRRIRLWTAYWVDEQGYQVSNAGYGPTKRLALEDVTI